MRKNVGEPRMGKINVVLVNPEIPQNTGNISRTCAVTGAALHIVRPTGFEISDRTLKRAGLDYWDKLDLTYYDGLDEFLRAHSGDKLFFFTSHTDTRFDEADLTGDVYLVFGRESVGLDPEILAKNRERTLRIPMREGVRCLNLSNAVAVAVYEALRRAGYPELK